jgi:hypothetical protein
MLIVPTVPTVPPSSLIGSQMTVVPVELLVTVPPVTVVTVVAVAVTVVTLTVIVPTVGSVPYPRQTFEMAPDHTVVTGVTVVTVAVPVVTGPVGIATIGALIGGIRISSRMIATVTIVDWFEASNLYIGKQTVVILLTVRPLTVVTVVMTVTVLVMTVNVLVTISLRGHPLTSVPGMMI